MGGSEGEYRPRREQKKVTVKSEGYYRKEAQKRAKEAEEKLAEKKADLTNEINQKSTTYRDLMEKNGIILASMNTLLTGIITNLEDIINNISKYSSVNSTSTWIEKATTEKGNLFTMKGTVEALQTETTIYMNQLSAEIEAAKIELSNLG